MLVYVVAYIKSNSQWQTKLLHTKLFSQFNS